LQRGKKRAEELKKSKRKVEKGSTIKRNPAGAVARSLGRTRARSEEN